VKYSNNVYTGNIFNTVMAEEKFATGKHYCSRLVSNGQCLWSYQLLKSTPN